MTTAAVTTGRPIYLTREGSVFRLAYSFNKDLLERTQRLPYATFDPDTKTWTTLVCAQSVQQLRAMYYEGLTDVAVDSLLHDLEDPAPCKVAELRPGTTRRPFYVHLAMRGDNTFERLRSLPGSTWEKKAKAISFPPTAAVALAELVDRGVIDDPSKLLTPAGTVVSFDIRTGQFVVRGEDPRAAPAFHKFFPRHDIFAAWQERGLDVAFGDSFTEEMYRGELARLGPGYQPDGLNVQLFEFQKRNVAVALQRSGFAIFDSPGLGKSAQGIAVGHELLRRGTVSRAIAIVPASIRSQWANEIARFTGCPLNDIAVVDGDPKKRAKAYEHAKTAKWFVIHYDVLSRDLDDIKELFNGALVIADEAHRLKTWNSARTQAALTLAKTASRRIALTGTPVETSPHEWYQVVSGFAIPGVLGSPNEFNDRYRYKTRFGHEGARNIPELRERCRMYFGRHTKEQVAAHLPPLRVQQVLLDPDPAYAAALRRAHREAANEIEAAAKERLEKGYAGAVLRAQEDDEEVETGAEMTAVSMLRMMCSSPRLVAGSDSAAAEALRAAGIVPDEDGPKLDELRVMAAEMKAVQEHRREQMEADGVTEATPDMVHGERMVIFTFSKEMAKLIGRRLEEDGIRHVQYTGDTSRKARDAAVAEFTDPNSDVIAFVATDAAAEGLNLGRCCSTLVQFDLAWTPSRAIQRMNRIHRLDGTAPRYLVLNFVIANTLEIGISRMLEQRADISDALFGETGGRRQTTGQKTKSKSIFEAAMDEFTAGYAGSRKKAKAAEKKSKSARSAAPGGDDAERPQPWLAEPPQDEYDSPPPPDDDYVPGEAPARTSSRGPQRSGPRNQAKPASAGRAAGSRKTGPTPMVAVPESEQLSLL